MVQNEIFTETYAKRKTTVKILIMLIKSWTNETSLVKLPLN